MMKKIQKKMVKRLPLSRGQMLVHLADTGQNKSALTEDKIDEGMEEAGLLARKDQQILAWLNSNKFNAKDAAAGKKKQIKINLKDAVVQPLTNIGSNKESCIIPENTSDIYESDNANEKNSNSNELNIEKTKILPNDTQSVNIMELENCDNSKIVSATSNILFESNYSEPSIYQPSSVSYVPSSDRSTDSDSCSDILRPSTRDLLVDLDVPVNSNITTTVAQQRPSLLEVDNYLAQIVERQNNIKKKRRTICKFCKNCVTNFERHLERHHQNEQQVKELLGLSKSSKEGKTMRRNIIALLRYETQFKEFIASSGTDNKLPCIHCKRLITPSYLRRHYKVCIVKPINETNQRIQHRALSQTLLVCAADTGNTDATIRVKNEVFVRMKADDIALIAKKDDLIRHYGENYLKRHKRAQITFACSNKLRECAKLLKEMRRRTNNSHLTFFEILSTTFFDFIVASSKTISNYDENSKKFKAPSLAIHLGTTLKQMCDLCCHLILKGVFKCNNIEEKLKDIKRFKLMVESQWNCEISSLALKDLAENKWNKPVRLPLTKDVIQFKEYLIDIATKNYDILQKDQSNKKAFRLLTEASLALTILFNRRRIGDVQYVHYESYLKDFGSIDQTEFLDALTESEKVLTNSYKRVVAGGKGSRAIVILFPKNLQNYINLLLQIRKESDIVPKVNPYLFACPGVEKQWMRADVVIRKFAEASGVENPKAISSNRLRKQIGTLMQIINLNKDEYAQFAKFMGHTEKTHKEFYEITQDAYQTAKVSKLLTLFDKGQGLEYKGKPLNEIDLGSASEVESDKDEELNGTEVEVVEQLLSDEDTNAIPVHKNKSNRVRWTQSQKNIVKKHFQKHIKRKKAPQKDECLKLIEQYKHTLHNLDWVRIKTFVYNVYKNNN